MPCGFLKSNIASMRLTPPATTLRAVSGSSMGDMALRSSQRAHLIRWRVMCSVVKGSSFPIILVASPGTPTGVKTWSPGKPGHYHSLQLLRNKTTCLAWYHDCMPLDNGVKKFQRTVQSQAQFNNPHWSLPNIMSGAAAYWWVERKPVHYFRE